MSKANRTRDRVQRVALDLFLTRGYDETTVADIAAAAGVTPMTFFRHFTSKERVVVGDPYDPMIAAVVAAQDPSLPPLDRVRLGIAQAWGNISGDEDELLRTRLRVGAAHPGLRARMREGNADTEQAIADALTSQGVSRFTAVVATAAVIGALTAALLEWAVDESGTALGDSILAALDVLDVTSTSTVKP